MSEEKTLVEVSCTEKEVTSNLLDVLCGNYPTKTEYTATAVFSDGSVDKYTSDNKDTAIEIACRTDM